MVTQNLKIVDCDERYWDFVRLLRMDHRVTNGFVEKMEISVEQQTVYMTKDSECYRIALLNNVPAANCTCKNQSLQQIQSKIL